MRRLAGEGGSGYQKRHYDVAATDELDQETSWSGGVTK